MRAPKIDKIIGLSLEQLREQAKKNNLYKPDLTVMQVRKERIQKPMPITQSPTPQVRVQKTTDVDTSRQSKQDTSQTAFETPESLEKITQIPFIIKTYP